MDVRNWKRVLLFWISEFEYTDKSYNNVEQSDVEAFFEHVRQQHKKIPENVNLLDFFQEHYSAYTPHVDDQNELSSADYVYVYSLLLHFTCVKQPEVYFQEKCRKLTNAAQESIALFFKLMLDCPLHNKENLRHIIGEVAAAVNQKLSPRHLSDASSSGTPSPAKTPLSKLHSRISPSTPKTVLLDERTRELFSLRAELENERYEKSVLEAQIKEYELKNNKLSKDYKKLQQQTLDMKNKFLEPEYDSTSSSPSEAQEQSQIIRRLNKEIKKKELEITNLTENLCSLRDEVSTLNKQLSNDKQNLKSYEVRLHESDCRLYELTQELQKTKETVKYLNEHKNELEQYIKEWRSSNGSSRTDLNNSSDCLDSSLLRSNTTLSPSHTPENMSSIVDMQLREKSREVQQLQQELLTLREMNATTINGIKEQAQLLGQHFKVPVSNIMCQERTEHADLMAYFQSFVLELQEVHQLYLDDLQNMQTLQEKLRAACQQNALQVEQLNQLKDRIEALESETAELSQEKLQLEGRLNECVDEITKLMNGQKQVLDEFEANREQLNQEYAILKSNTEQEIKQLGQQVAAEQQQKLQLVNDIESYRLKLQESEEKNVQLTQSIDKLSEKLQQHALNETAMREKYEDMLLERDTLKSQQRSANAHLDKMQTLLNEKEKEMLVLGEEIIEVRALNIELEQRMEDLSSKFELERVETEERMTKVLHELETKKAILAASAAEEKQLKTEINTLMQYCELSLEDSNSAKDNVKAISNRVSYYKQEAQECLQLLEQKQVDNEASCEKLKFEIERLDNKYAHQLADLKEQLDCTLAEKQNLEKELKLVIEKHNEVKMTLKKKETNYKTLDAEFANLEKEYLEMQRNMNDLDVQKAHFEQQLNILKNEHMIELDKKNVEEIKLKHELKLKAEQLEKIQLHQRAKETELNECKQQIEYLKLSVDEKTQQIKELNEAQVVLKKQQAEEKEKFNTKLHYLEQELANNSKNFALQQKNHEIMLENLQLKEDELQTQQDLVKQTKRQLVEKEKELLETQQVKMQAVAEHKELQQIVDMLKQNLEEQQALVKRTDAELNNILATLENAANSVIQLDIEKVFNNSPMETAQPHLESLKSCLKKFVTKLAQLEQEVKENEDQLQQKDKQLLKLSDKTQEFEQKLINSANKIEKLELEVKTAFDEVQKLQEDLKLLLQRLQQADKEKQQLAANLQTEETQRQALAAEVLELTNSRVAMESKLNSLTELYDKTTHEKQQAVGKLTVLEQTHSKLLEEHRELQEKLQANEVKVMTLSQEKQSLEERSKHVELDKKSSQEKLSAENVKLNKRIEQLALKLGEAQARGNNLEREQKKLLESQQQTLETLQSDKEKLSQENGTLKERLARSETLQDQLATRVSQLDVTNGKLQATQKRLQDAKDEMAVKLQQVQRQRETQEEKIRQLNMNLEQCEQQETRLKLEVGALNSQLEVKHELLKKLELERKEQLEIQNAQAQQMEDLIAQVKQLNSTIQERESKKDEQLEKLELQLTILKKQHEEEKQELMVKLKELNVEKDSKVAEFQQLLEQQEKLEEKLEKANLEVNMKERELLILRTEKDELEEQRQLLAQECAEKQSQLAERVEICAKLEQQIKDVEKIELTQNEQLSLRLSTCEEMLTKEQEMNAKLRTDNQILQAKYAETKQRLQESIQQSEERIKENRLELEGKLEKMKNKMKTLYSEEITKIKSKQERELLAHKSEIESLRAQNHKFEEQTNKLRSQILRLNDNMLENKRQQEFLSTKLKHIQDADELQFKQPQCTPVVSSNNLHQTVSGTSTISGAPSAGTFAMEDEEGEVFNNTYLTDLKTGRMSELMGKHVGAEELQYRNSLVPPHLKSTYAAQYDHGLGEDEMKDSSHAFDDSMSGLLTGGGVRKKISGATHYKRPGPPTPSKHGGRLSLGGNSEPPREILKEYNDNSCSKTPARFGFFGSRFSIGKDEYHENEGGLRKLIQMRNFEQKQDRTKKSQKSLKSKSRAVCTSTPRRSKTYYDRQRPIEHSLSDNNNNNNESEVVVLKNSAEEADTPLTANTVDGKTRRQSRRLSRLCFANSGGSTEQRRKSIHLKRTSFYLPGNMFAYARSPCQAKKRHINRKKAQDQRRERFNVQREIVSSDSATPQAKIDEDIEKLITSQDLLTFDKNVKKELLCDDNQNACLEEDWVDIEEGNSAEFERLLHATQSQAPFEVQKIQFDGNSVRNSSQSSVSAISNAGNDWKGNKQVSAITQHSHATSTGSAHLSRTIYGGSVIFNRRIPNVSSTFVRKSSIYIKNNDASSLGVDDIILVTDQTITIADLARMWKQMNNTARVVICSVLFASLSSIFMLVTSFV